VALVSMSKIGFIGGFQQYVCFFYGACCVYVNK